jgi:hypothetical protein
LQLADLGAHVATLVHDAARTAEQHAAELAAAESARQEAEIDLSAVKAVAKELEDDVQTERASRQAAEAAAALAAAEAAASSKRADDAKADAEAAIAACNAAVANASAREAEIASLRADLDSAARRASEAAARVNELELALTAATATAEALGSELQEIQVGTPESEKVGFVPQVVPPMSHITQHCRCRHEPKWRRLQLRALRCGRMRLCSQCFSPYSGVRSLLTTGRRCRCRSRSCGGTQIERRTCGRVFDEVVCSWHVFRLGCVADTKSDDARS